MKLALAWLQLRNTYGVDTYMWQFSHTGLMYTVGRLDVDDTSTRIARRNVDNFLSPQDCLNFLRFSQEQVRQPDTSLYPTHDVALLRHTMSSVVTSITNIPRVQYRPFHKKVPYKKLSLRFTKK